MNSLLKDEVTKTFLEALYGDRLLHNHNIFQKIICEYFNSGEFSNYRVNGLGSASPWLCSFKTDSYIFRDKKEKYINSKEDLFSSFDANQEKKNLSILKNPITKKEPIFFTKDIEMHINQEKYLGKTRRKLKKILPNNDFEFLSDVSRKLFNFSIFLNWECSKEQTSKFGKILLLDHPAKLHTELYKTFPVLKKPIVYLKWENSKDYLKKNDVLTKGLEIGSLIKTKDFLGSTSAKFVTDFIEESPELIEILKNIIDSNLINGKSFLLPYLYVKKFISRDEFLKCCLGFSRKLTYQSSMLYEKFTPLNTPAMSDYWNHIQWHDWDKLVEWDMYSSDIPDTYVNFTEQDFKPGGKAWNAMFISPTKLKSDYSKQLDKEEILINAKNFTNLSNIEKLIEKHETSTVELKSTFSKPLEKYADQKILEHTALKSVVGFLNNKKGGVLIIGIDDNLNPVGIESDLNGTDHDKYKRNFVQKVQNLISKTVLSRIDISIERYKEKNCLLVRCEGRKKGMDLEYLQSIKDKNVQECYVRTEAAVIKLEGKDLINFHKQMDQD